MNPESPSALARASQVTPDCWICGEVTREVPDYRSVSLVGCATCAFTFQPEIVLQELRAHHDSEYFASRYPPDDRQRTHEARLRLRWMKRTGVTSGRLLEVGAAQGQFLREARGAGFTVSGIEPEPRTAHEAKARSGVDVVVGYVEDAELPEATLDVVCMWHVLEHVPQPVAALDRLREAIRPGGSFFCEVPNIASTWAEAAGDRWAYLDPEHHVNFFAPDTLASALRRSGFEGIETHTVPMIHYERPRPAAAFNVARHLRSAIVNPIPPFFAHPSRHELLRAVARVPA